MPSEPYLFRRIQFDLVDDDDEPGEKMHYDTLHPLRAVVQLCRIDPPPTSASIVELAGDKARAAIGGPFPIEGAPADGYDVVPVGAEVVIRPAIVARRVVDLSQIDDQPLAATVDLHLSGIRMGMDDTSVAALAENQAAGAL